MLIIYKKQLPTDQNKPLIHWSEQKKQVTVIATVPKSYLSDSGKYYLQQKEIISPNPNLYALL